MLVQHQTSASSMPRVCWASGLAVHTAGRHRSNARYTDTLPAIPTIPAQYFESMLGLCWPDAWDAGPHSAWRQTRHGNLILG